MLYITTLIFGRTVLCCGKGYGRNKIVQQYYYIIVII